MNSKNRIRASCLTLFAASVILLVGAVVVIGVFARRGRLPDLDRTSFDAAREAWDNSGPPSYDITIEVSGRQAATYSAQVRDNETISATRNGMPLKQKRTLRTWSVPGMFDTIESDVENVELVTSGNAPPGTPELTLRARFHPEWRYPDRYQRVQWGSSHEVNWRVTDFKIIAAQPSAP